MSQKPHEVEFRKYIVAVVDFLGQSNALLKWDFLPNSSTETETFIKAARDTYGQILTWRKSFERHFADLLSSYQLSDEDAKKTPDGGKALREFQSTSINFSHFSDTIVIYSPLENEYGHLSLCGTFSFLFTSGLLLLSALNQGTVFRGGVEIGMAALFPDADLYGPSLAKAHQLESKVAQYPRIVVGSDLVGYMKSHTKSIENTPYARTNRAIAERCLGILDSDGKGDYFVDYVGQNFRQLSPVSNKLDMLYVGALKFIENQIKVFEQNRKSKLLERYKIMREYFTSNGVSEKEKDD